MGKHETVREMIDYIKDNEIKTFAQFMDYVYDDKMLIGWFELLCDDKNVIDLIVNYIGK
jgi:hypothetical protein